jgi:hypothetical protein
MWSSIGGKEVGTVIRYNTHNRLHRLQCVFYVQRHNMQELTSNLLGLCDVLYVLVVSTRETRVMSPHKCWHGEPSLPGYL